MKARPNILLVFPDQLRGDWIELAGQVPVRTPNLSDLARRGVVFSRAWTPAPICAPARACMATLHELDRSPVRHNGENLPLDAVTLHGRLTAHGYAVSTVGKLDLLKQRMDWGVDGRHATGPDGDDLRAIGFTGGQDCAGKHDALRAREQGMGEPYLAYLEGLGLAEAHYQDFLRREPGKVPRPVRETMQTPLPPPPAYANTAPTPLPDHAYCDNWIGRQALDELTTLLEGEQPWFLTVNFAGPHEPLDVTEAMQARWTGINFPPPHACPGHDPDLHQQMRRNYAAMIEVIDDWLGRFVQAVERAAAFDDTLIVFASDHGEMLGDLNIWAKSVPFEPSLHVPLVVAGAGTRNPGTVRDDPVSLLDVSATLLDLAQCGGSNGDGMSLGPVLESGKAHRREIVFSGLGNWRAAADRRFKLVAGFDADTVAGQTQFEPFDPACIASARLYERDADPWDTRDVSARHPEAAARLKTALARQYTAGAAAAGPQNHNPTRLSP
jgi:arylsulfatase A-like enzyme